MSNEIIEKVINCDILTQEEVDFVIDFIAKTVIRNLKNNFNDDYETKCDYSSQYLLELSSKMNYAYYGYETEQFLMPELKHHFGFVGFKTEVGPLWYIIDLTYKQFENENYPIALNGTRITIEGPANKISDENKDLLLKKGYIKLTHRNLRVYIDSFIKSYPKNINPDYIYQIVYKELDDKQISIQSDDQFSSSGEEINSDIKGVKL